MGFARLKLMGTALVLGGLLSGANAQTSEPVRIGVARQILGIFGHGPSPARPRAS